MKNKKIVLLSLFSVLFIFFFGQLNANTTSVISNGYSEPIVMDYFQFGVKLLDNGSVYTYWKTYDDSEEKLKYYKIIRSSKNSNPVYPEDGYITYSTDINFTEYTDNSVPFGINYYRICAITTDNNRYCSNVEKIFREEIKQIICTMEYAPVCGDIGGVKKTFGNKCMLNSSGAKYLYTGECGNPINTKVEIKNTTTVSNNISSTLKYKASKLIKDFIIKVEKKYTNVDKRIEILKTVISRFEALSKNNPNATNLINYMIEILQIQIDSYNDGFSDIESILNDY